MWRVDELRCQHHAMKIRDKIVNFIMSLASTVVNCLVELIGLRNVFYN
jgi:hypothetical protein